jgi:hypothetical protein
MIFSYDWLPAFENCLEFADTGFLDIIEFNEDMAPSFIAFEADRLTDLDAIEDPLIIPIAKAPP